MQFMSFGTHHPRNANARYQLLVAFLFVFLLAVASASNTGAQEPQNPIQWTASIAGHGIPARPGEVFSVQISATIADGWHLYAIDQKEGGPIPTRVSVPAGQLFSLNGGVKEPPPTAKFDPNFNLETRFFEKHVTFIVPVKVGAAAQSASSMVNVDVRYQACNDKLCMPPRTVHLSATAITGTNPASGPAAQSTAGNSPTTQTTADAGSSSSQQPAQASRAVSFGSAASGAQRDLRSFIWLAMGMGALSLLTPCVFPMIPITVSYFTSHSAQSRYHAIRNAIIYALGIILTFTALGLGLALVFGAGGVNQLAANPWVNLLITAIFVAFALSLFGLFFIQAPARLVERLDSVTRSPGTSEVIGILLMGLTFTLTSFTCTSPFVGTVLVMAAQGNWKWPFVGMMAFSSIFALPFFILALAPQFASQLPKSGSWMNSVKVVMGFLELAAAMKFISNVDLIWHWGIFTRETVLGIWIVIALLICVYLVGKLPMWHQDSPKKTTPVRLVLSAGFLLLAIWLGSGFLGRPLGEIESFLPPMNHGATTSAFASNDPNAIRLSWISNDYERALAQARSENKPLFVNFTGYTCTNCRWMEANMFTRPEVRKELTQFVLAELYTDGSGKKFEDQQDFQQQKFGTVALPFYVVQNPNGETIATYAGLTRNPSEFLAFLDSGLSRPTSR